MVDNARLPADAVLSLARRWFSVTKNHERDESPEPWLPELCGEDAAVYLALFGVEVLKHLAPATTKEETDK